MKNELTLSQDMNILNILTSIFLQKWTLGGIVLTVVNFIMPSVLLQAAPAVFAGLGEFLKAIGLVSSVLSLGLTCIFIQRAWYNLKRDRLNYLRELEDFEHWQKKIKEFQNTLKSKDNV